MKKNQTMNWKRRSLGSYLQAITILLFMSLSTSAFSQTVVNSLLELKPYLSQDNVNVKLAPGTYTMDASDVSNGNWGEDVPFMSWAKALMVISGSNNTFDFTGVTINFNTNVFTAFGNYDIWELHISGNNNEVRNITMVDVGSVHDAPTKGATNIHIDGQYNIVNGLHLSSKGSSPYYYGDAFGKGSGSSVNLQKHSAVIMRGDYNTIKNSTVIHRAFGHIMCMQAASNPTIDSCYFEGEMRSTDDMLLEEGTGSIADELNFITTYGYRLPPGYMKSLTEEGIRTYNRGETLINGEYIERGTENVTVKNTTVKNARGGCSIVLSSGWRHVENVTLLGCEFGFSVGNASLINCKADCSYGAAYMNAYDTQRNTIDGDLTILPPDGDDTYHNGGGVAAFIGGVNCNLNIHDGGGLIGSGLEIRIGGNRGNISDLEADQHTATNNTVNNYTNYPLVVSEASSGNNGVSGGMITDFGTNNNFVHSAVSTLKIEAEDYSDMDGVSEVTTTDEGGGENLTSIESGNWVEYEIDVPFSGTYSMDYRVASESVDGDLSLSVDGSDLEQITFSATGGAQTWETVRSETPFYLTKGIQTLKITANSADWNINWIDLLLECADVDIVSNIKEYNQLDELLFSDISNEITTFPGNSIVISLEPTIGGSWSWTGPNNFMSESLEVEFTDITKEQGGEYLVSYTNECGQVTYKTIQINVEDALLIQAEDYNLMDGVTTEVSDDIEGGSHITSIENGDWMEYEINVPFSALYTFDCRVIAASSEGSFNISIDGDLIDDLSFSNTNWEAVSTNLPVYLNAGIQTLRLTAKSDGWKINYLRLQASETVRECLLPFSHNGFVVSNEMVEWSSGPMDISCETNLETHFILNSLGIVTSSDYINIYYKVDGGEMISIAEKTGAVEEMIVSANTISGTTLELIVQAETYSDASSYNISKILVLTESDPHAIIQAEEYDDNNGTSKESTSDTGGGVNLGSITDGNWVKYSNINLSPSKSINLRVSSTSAASSIEIRLDSLTGPILRTVELPNTGNWKNWQTVSTYIDEVVGFYDVYLIFKNSETYVCNINWLQFSDEFIKGPTDPYERFEAEINDGESGTVAITTTDIDGDEELSELVDGDYIMYSALDVKEAGSITARVACDVDGSVIEVRSGKVNGSIISFIDVPNTGSLTSWQTISADLNQLDEESDIYFVFRGEGSDLLRLNWLQFEKGDSPVYDVIEPLVRIEAQDYSRAFGTVTNITTDEDGGEELGSIQNGNWILFRSVDLSDAQYVNLRVSSQHSGGQVELRTGAYDSSYLAVLPIPNTGSTYNWETISGELWATGGIHDVYVIFKGPNSDLANINWFQFTDRPTSTNDTSFDSEIKVYPNPIVDKLYIQSSVGAQVGLFNVNGIKLKESKLIDNKGVIDMQELSSGVYIIKVTSKGKVLTKKVFKN